MFGKTVKVDGREYFVTCTPETTDSEVLEKAARMARAAEKVSGGNNYQCVSYS